MGKGGGDYPENWGGEGAVGGGGRGFWEGKWDFGAKKDFGSKKEIFGGKNGIFFFFEEKGDFGMKKKRIWGWKGRLWREIQDLFLGKGGDFVAKKYSGAKKGDFGVFQWIHPAENGKSVRERGQNRDRGLKKKGINGKKVG